MLLKWLRLLLGPREQSDEKIILVIVAAVVIVPSQSHGLCDAHDQEGSPSHTLRAALIAAILNGMKDVGHKWFRRTSYCAKVSQIYDTTQWFGRRWFALLFIMSGTGF